MHTLLPYSSPRFILYCGVRFSRPGPYHPGITSKKQADSIKLFRAPFQVYRDQVQFFEVTPSRSASDTVGQPSIGLNT